MAFQEFTQKGGKFKPQIIINRSGGFTLSSGMHHRYGLDQYNGVRIYFDKETFKVGIQLTKGDYEGTFRLKKRPEEKGAYFSARSFMQANNLDSQIYYGRYSPEEFVDEKVGKLFVITLKEHE